MSTESPYTHPSLPPQAPMEMMPPYQSEAKWPKVLGILGVIFGALTIVSTLMGLLSTALASRFSDEIPEEAIPPELLAQLNSMQTMLLYAATILVAGLLLAGSVYLLKRRKIAYPLLMLAAVLKIGVSLWEVKMTQPLQEAHLAHLKNSSENSKDAPDMAKIENVIETVGTVSMVVGVLWACALPSFLILWLNRRPIRKQMADWT